MTSSSNNYYGNPNADEARFIRQQEDLRIETEHEAYVKHNENASKFFHSKSSAQCAMEQGRAEELHRMGFADLGYDNRYDYE